MRSYLLLAALLFMVTSPPASAGQTVYTDSCVEAESGDVAGHVITSSGDQNPPIVSFGSSEGALKGPVSANVSSYERTSGRLNFSADTSSGTFLFKGMIKADC